MRVAGRFLAMWVGAMAPAAPVWAQDWMGIAIGNPTGTAATAFADAFHAAEALGELDDIRVDLYRDVGPDETAAVLSTAEGQPRVLIYLAGEVTGPPDAPVFRGSGFEAEGVDLVGYLRGLAESGTQHVVLLVETCAGRGQTGALSLTAPAGMVLDVVASGPCTAPRLTDLLHRGEGGTLAARLSAVAPGADLGGLTFRIAEAPAPNPAQAPSGPVRDVITILPSAITAAPEVATVTPVGFSTVVTGASPGAAPPQVTLPAPAVGGVAALPLADGFPEPSIIVGIIPGEETFDQVGPEPGEVTGSALSYDDLEARNGLRESDPALFADLVATGAFDPPAAELAAALQTELARMNCYRAGIDGIWGNGSRAAVDRYFEEAGATAPTREPVVDLFRTIISREDVACPTPVVAAPRPAATTAARPQTTAAPRPATTASRPAPAPAPAPAAPTGGGGLNSVNINGAFR